jgi:hypothetical protein
MHQKRQLPKTMTVLLLFAATCTITAQKGFKYEAGAPYLEEHLAAAAVLPDGRIAAAGRLSSPQKKGDLWAALYNTAGDTVWTWIPCSREAKTKSPRSREAKNE